MEIRLFFLIAEFTNKTHEDITTRRRFYFIERDFCIL